MLPGKSPLSLSPDGKELAFILTRGQTKNNQTCHGVVVLRLADGATRLVDAGGEQILAPDDLRGSLDPAGEAAILRPSWSPDGQWIAYLRRDHGITQAWRAKADGGQAEPVSNFSSDVEDLAWSTDGQRLILAWRPKTAEVNDSITHEGKKGWLYDAHIVPSVSARPLLPAGLAREIVTIDLADRIPAPASAQDAASLKALTLSDDATKPNALAPDGSHAWTEAIGKDLRPQYGVHVRNAQQQAIPCAWKECRGAIIGLWWQDASRTLLFLRKEGWNKGSMGLYRWRPGGAAPRRILQTDGVISGCLAATIGLICNAEEARRPRHIVLIDALTGKQTLLFDPNPEWAHFALGAVQRLTWRNSFGLPAWGDLVLPVGYRPGTRVPLIITQYLSRGFLRGGTGDEYPVFPFAARGFAVLSLDRPPFYSTSLPNITTYDQSNAANQKDWMERQSLLSSLTVGVDKVVAMGVADPARMGITGLSDGATTAYYALIHHPVFAAAAISTCCVEPHTAMTSGGIAWADWQHEVLGYPRASENRPDFWRPVSLTLNASHIDTPLLMQLADSEFQLSLEAFTALREAGKPVEMYIYPDEYHEKVSPTHRLNSYNRSVDWFAFWLQGQEDVDPDKAGQYRRWEKMRSSLPEKDGDPAINPTNEPKPQHPQVP